MYRITFISFALAVVNALLPQTVEASLNLGTQYSVPFETYEQLNEGTPVTFQANIWGDALLWEQETSSGYTFVKNPVTGYWCYAVLDAEGDYVPSDSAIGINAVPAGLSPHLRRGPTAIALIDSFRAEIDEANVISYETYQLNRDQADTNRLGILFWEFENRAHDEEHPYTQDNVNMMFVSEGEYYGPRHGDFNAHTPWGEEPFGSIRDYFLEISGNSNNERYVEAGGAFCVRRQPVNCLWRLEVLYCYWGTEAVSLEEKETACGSGFGHKSRCHSREGGNPDEEQ